MDHVLADVSLQRHRLMQQYLEIEAAYIKHLEEVEYVYEKTHKMNQRALEFQPSQREVKEHGNLPNLLLLHWASFRHCKADSRVACNEFEVQSARSNSSMTSCLERDEVYAKTWLRKPSANRTCKVLPEMLCDTG